MLNIHFQKPLRRTFLVGLAIVVGPATNVLAEDKPASVPKQAVDLNAISRRCSVDWDATRQPVTERSEAGKADSNLACLVTPQKWTIAHWMIGSTERMRNPAYCF
jgi:hypothetical protein